MLERLGALFNRPVQVNKPESEDNSDKCFNVLGHGYWLSEVKSGITGKTYIKPSMRTHLEERALAKGYHEGKFTHINLVAGNIWGEEYPSLAEIMGRNLVKKYHVPQESITIKPVAADTGTEIDVFLANAEGKNTDLADVAMRTHNCTLPLHYKRKGREDVKRLNVEGVLKDDDPRVQKVVDKFDKSRYEWSYRFYQVVNRAIMFFDPEYKFLKGRAGKERSRKSEYSLGGPLERFPVDKYSL